MTLIIDLSQKEPKLVLKDRQREIAIRQLTDGLFQLSETLLPEIDRFLKKNKFKLDDVQKIKVIDSPDSMVSTRIAKAVALGLKAKV